MFAAPSRPEMTLHARYRPVIVSTKNTSIKGKMMSKCRSCQEDIVWIKTQKGKSHPVNPQFEMRWVEFNGGWRLVKTYTSHFGTCPQAKEWSKKKEVWKVGDRVKEECRTCDGEQARVRENGPHLELYCVLCGKHIRFIKKTKDD